MKIYIPNKSRQQIGGGFTFISNLLSAISPYVQIARRWEDCDVLLIAGISIIDKHEIYAAHKAGKKIVLRVDNVPRKSRNQRSTPHERLAEMARLSDAVVYQSEWAKRYVQPLCGEGVIIYNGVNKSIFYPKNRPYDDENGFRRYLFAYHGKNDQKAFWDAHYIFQMEYRENPGSEFWFLFDFGRETDELKAADFDFWQGEKYVHLQPPIQSQEGMAELYRKCTHLIYPAIMDAAPNTVLEARACGLEVIGTRGKQYCGSREMLEIQDISHKRMGEEYVSLFKLVLEPDGIV